MFISVMRVIVMALWILVLASIGIGYAGFVCSQKHSGYYNEKRSDRLATIAGALIWYALMGFVLVLGAFMVAMFSGVLG